MKERIRHSYFTHSLAARAVIPESVLAAATLLNLRLIVDYASFENDANAPTLYAVVRKPREYGGPPDAPHVIAYVHAQIYPSMVPDENAWMELLSQLWPGY